MSELNKKRDGSKALLKFLIPMWACNMTALIICAFAGAYAEDAALWYEQPFKGFTIGFVLSKIVLSFLILTNLWDATRGKNDS